MRKFQYNELGKELPDGSIENIVVTITEQEILDQYWDYWFNRMMAVGKPHLTSIDNCLDDWVAVNWAWEIK